MCHTSWTVGALAFGASVVGAAGAAGAQSPANLNPTQDARIVSAAADISEPDGFLSVYTNGVDNIQRSLIQFDLSSIPAGSIVTSATLTLKADRQFGANPSERGMQVYRVTQSWSEATVTWNNAPTYVDTNGGTDFLPYATNLTNPEDEAAITWDVTTLASAWVATPSSNNGLLILSFPGNLLTFDSSELSPDGSTPVVAPALTINYVPEPAGLALLGLGSLGVLTRRRRQV